MTPEHPAEPPDPPSPQLAGLAARITAKLIDVAVTAIIAFVAFSVFEFFATFNVLITSLASGPKHYTDSMAYRFASPFLAVLLFEAALIASTARKGTTPGKKLLKIRVVAQLGLRPPTALRAIVRWALPLAPTAPLIDAFIRDIPEFVNEEHWPALSGRVWWIWVALGWWLLVHTSTLWDSQRRGWHDKAAGTIVINAPRPPHPASSHDLLTKWQRKWRRRLDLPFE